MASTLSEYQRRRARMIDYLGGRCVRCGSTEDLQFDHVDRSTKSFDVSSNWSIAWERLKEELNKCQLLCKEHHLQKSSEFKDLNQVEHGQGVKGKRDCRCELCRPLKNAYAAAMKARRKSR